MPRARVSTASHSAGECQELDPNREAPRLGPLPPLPKSSDERYEAL